MHLRQARWNLVDVAREYFGVKHSREIWDWIEAENNFFLVQNTRVDQDGIPIYSKHPLSEKKSTELFCGQLKFSSVGRLDYKPYSYLFLISKIICN